MNTKNFKNFVAETDLHIIANAVNHIEAHGSIRKSHLETQRRCTLNAARPADKQYEVVNVNHIINALIDKGYILHKVAGNKKDPAIVRENFVPVGTVAAETAPPAAAFVVDHDLDIDKIAAFTETLDKAYGPVVYEDNTDENGVGEILTSTVIAGAVVAQRTEVLNPFDTEREYSEEECEF